MVDPDAKRRRARELARESANDGDPVGWFERLYAEASGGRASVPWEDGVPSPTLAAWVAEHPEGVRDRRALVVGCGGGHDAALLAESSARVVAVDVSVSAIAGARARYGGLARVDWVVGDLREPLAEWGGGFDLVVEINTLQVLPAAARRELEQRLANLVAEGGCLWLCCRLRSEAEPAGDLPWPLTASELDRFESEFGFERLESLDLVDSEDPPVRRALRVWRRPSRSTDG